jgi:hypothetical protein
VWQQCQEISIHAWSDTIPRCNPEVADLKTKELRVVGDFKIFMDALKKNNPGLNLELRTMIEDILMLKTPFKFCQFAWVLRSANMVVHVLSKWGFAQLFFC